MKKISFRVYRLLVRAARLQPRRPDDLHQSPAKLLLQHSKIKRYNTLTHFFVHSNMPVLKQCSNSKLFFLWYSSSQRSSVGGNEFASLSSKNPPFLTSFISVPVTHNPLESATSALNPKIMPLKTDPPGYIVTTSHDILLPPSSFTVRKIHGKVISKASRIIIHCAKIPQKRSVLM